MLSARLACLMIALPLLLWQGVRPALAQQEKERRVFTNEDVARPAPSAPAAEAAPEPAEAPAASAAQHDAPAEAAPEGESVSAPDTGAPPSSSQMSIPHRLKSARFLQDTLRRYLAEYSENLEAADDSARYQGWQDMVNSLMSLLQQNQQYINDLEQQISEQQTQASAEP